MDTVIFLPGGGGSCLELPDGDQVWPPNLAELFNGYGRMQQLIDSRLKPTQIVNSIPPNELIALPVYRHMLSLLDEIHDQFPQIEIVPFPYDFRKSVIDSAARLKAKIKSLYSEGKRSIALVGHSTGNQVARAVLEHKQWQHANWFSSLKLYLGICGPHFGAPLVLEYALGLSDWMRISASDMKTFSRDHRYPGCYQLLPFRDYNMQYDALNDVVSGAEDFYQANVAQKLGLDPTNLGAALALQRILTFQNMPSGVAYKLVAGQGQQTDVTINYNGANYVSVLHSYAGDNTLPLSTSAPNTLQPTILFGDHFSIMHTRAFRDLLWNELTGSSAPTLVTEKAQVVLSLDRPVYIPNEEISILIVPDDPTTSIVADFILETAQDEQTPSFGAFDRKAFTYSGPEIRFISARMPAPSKPGVYRLSLKGEKHATDGGAAPVFVVDPKTERRAQRNQAP